MFILEQGTFREISEFRYALEMQALTLAMEHVTDQQLEDMNAYMELLEQTPEEEQKAYFDKKIHYTIAEASGNRFIIDNLQALTVVMDVFIKDMRAKILSDGSNNEGLMMSHRSIVKALTDRDIKKGREALEEHFNYIYDYLDR